MRSIGMWLSALVVVSQVATAHAQLQNDVQIHGFVSQGALKTTDNNYLAKSKAGSLQFTEVGINFTDAVTDKLRIGVQLFTHDLGPLGNYNPQFDWYYLDYRVSDLFGVRAGRTKLPWGLYNESNDVDAGRVPILLPQSVYPVSSREFLFAQNGGEFYGSLPLAAAGRLEYRLYGGTVNLSNAEVSAEYKDFDAPYLIGGRLMWQPPIEGLQLGASAQKLRLDLDFTPTPEQTTQYQMQGLLPANFAGVVNLKIPAVLWIASLEYQDDALLLAGEFTRSYVDAQTNLLLPNTHTVSQGYYAMASYRVSPWFVPGVYYSALFPNIHHAPHDRSAYQHDVAMTFRYDLTANWLIKLEQHYMHGTAALDSTLNDNKPQSVLVKDWGLFLIKTTAYF